MPPRKTRADANADKPQPGFQPPPQSEPQVEPTPPSPPAQQLPTHSTNKAKGKAKVSRHQPLVDEQPSTAATQQPTTDTAPQEATSDSAHDAAPPQSETTSQQPPQPQSPPSSEAKTVAEAGASGSKMSMQERMAKLSSLCNKMADASKANRKDLISQQSRSRAQAASGRQGAGRSRKLTEAEKLLEERDLKESGEDVERHRNFGYTIEDSERWEAKLEQKEQRKDKGLMDFKDLAERSYRRQVRALKPDLSGYAAQRAAYKSQYGGAAGSSELTVRSGADASAQVVQREDLYRDASTVYYGDHKPSDEAIDRVVGHLNLEQEQLKRRSRNRKDDDDGEVDYINKKNQHFNKKLKRYYDEYTKEIRENFERGTAL